MAIYQDVLSGYIGDAGYKGPCAVATTADMTNAMSGLPVIDGYQTLPNDRVLVWKNVNPVTNGIYNVNSGAWTRALDFSNSNGVTAGTQIMVFNGAQYGGFSFTVQQSNIVFGATSITFKINNLGVG